MPPLRGNGTPIGLHHTAGSLVNQCIGETIVSMNQQFKRGMGVVGLAVAVALSACGGGGDSPASVTTPASVVSNGTADPYVGTYQTNCEPNGSSSYRAQVSVVKKSTNTADVTYRFFAYTGTSCAGTGKLLDGFDSTETWTITGTKTASGKTVDKISSQD